MRGIIFKYQTFFNQIFGNKNQVLFERLFTEIAIKSCRNLLFSGEFIPFLYTKLKINRMPSNISFLAQAQLGKRFIASPRERINLDTLKLSETFLASKFPTFT